MTRTALRALTVAALSAAVTITTVAIAPSASAEGCGFEDPSVPGGWVATDCPPGEGDGVQDQLPEEVIGGARCGDTDMVIVSIAPDGTPICGYPVPPVPAGAAPATPQGQATAITPAPAPKEPGSFQAPMADGTVVPTAAPAFTFQGLMEMLHDALGPLFRILFRSYAG